MEFSDRCEEDTQSAEASATTSLMGVSHGLVVAARLPRTKKNRAAKTCLTALDVSLVVMITSCIPAYGGFYDVHSWRRFARGRI
ncbi:MAG: hypothetical protein U0V87_12385 [Acidobacteriota bacterium]